MNTSRKVNKVVLTVTSSDASKKIDDRQKPKENKVNNMNDKEVTLADLLACMKEQKRESREDKKEMQDKFDNFMTIIEKNAKDTKEDMDQMNAGLKNNEMLLRTTNKKVDRNEKVLLDKIKEQEMKMNKMKESQDVRMMKLEEILNKATIQQRTKKGDLEDDNEDKTSYLPVETDKEDVTTKDLGRTNSTWMENAKKQLEEDAKQANTTKTMKNEEMRKKINEDRKRFKGMKSLRKWFGEESDQSEVSNESSSDDNENWDQKIQRQERNKIRKKRNKDNKIMKEMETLKKASLILGLQPISKEEIDYHENRTGDPKQAREHAVRDYLRNYLQYNTEELDRVKIEDTKVSANGEDMVYVAFGDMEMIRDIHWRISEIRDARLTIRNYIPPQIWGRYTYLSRECATYRKENPTIKTQLRYGTRDIEIMIKVKGTNEPYKTVPIDKITNPENVPKYDHDISWKQRSEKKPRRKLVRAENTSRGMEDDNGTLAQMLRQRSMDSNTRDIKKQKRTHQTDSRPTSGMDTE